MKSLLAIPFIGMLIIGTGFAVQTQTAEQEVNIESDQQVTLEVEGMSCSMCERSMKNSLEKLDGVERVDKVDAGEGVASVWLTSGKTISDEQFKKAVEDAGFKLKRVKRNVTEDSGDSR